MWIPFSEACCLTGGGGGKGRRGIECSSVEVLSWIWKEPLFDGVKFPSEDNETSSISSWFIIIGEGFKSLQSSQECEILCISISEMFRVLKNGLLRVGSDVNIPEETWERCVGVGEALESDRIVRMMEGYIAKICRRKLNAQ